MKEFKKKTSITKREEGSIGRYFQDLMKIPLISMNDEIKLSVKIKNGDIIAIQKLAAGNLRFVVSVANVYQGQGLGLDDRVSAGNIGLLTAARKFDGKKNVKFISFAVWWIRQEILIAVSEQKRIVRLPGNQVVTLLKVLKAEPYLEQKYGRPPTVFELSEYLDIPEDKILQSFTNRGQTQYLDAPAVEGGDVTLMETIEDQMFESPDYALRCADLKNILSRALKILCKKEQQILEFCYGLNGHIVLTTRDVAHKLGVSIQTVQTKRRNAIAILGAVPELQHLRDFL